MRSPTERSLILLRKSGYLAEVVERWIPMARIRKDLWGFDIAGIHPSGRMVLVQTTSASNAAARRTKLVDQEHWDRISTMQADLQVHGWVKKKNRWAVNVWRWAGDRWDRILDTSD